jgi:hypothetical protein
MSTPQWIALGALFVLFVFVIFTFEQGIKVKPRKGNPWGGLPAGGGVGGSQSMG